MGIRSLRIEISTQNLPNTKHECYRLNYHIPWVEKERCVSGLVQFEHQ